VKTSELELDKDTVEERQYEEHGEFDVLQEEFENLEDLVDEMSALEYTYDGCTAGEGGAKLKTPALAPAQAVEYLRFHREDAHGQRGAAAGGGADEVHLSKIPRPEISGGRSQEDFNFFTRKWDQYVRASNEKDGNKLKDQLTNCPDGNNVNTLTMISAKQKRDEPVRQFEDCLRDLSVTCTCGIKVSEVDKWVRMSLIGGLIDEDTKQEVLSKVYEMPLDETITCGGQGDWQDRIEDSGRKIDKWKDH
jgi:hypothetical protein